MPRLDRPRPYVRSGAPLLAASLWLVVGCNQQAAPPIFDPDPAPIVDAPDLDIDVSVAPQADDPREVDVWVRTSQPALWKALPADSSAPEWNRLIVIRTQQEAEALPLDKLGDVPTPLGLKGEYAIVEGSLRFRLAEPLRAGAAYRVEFYRSAIPGFDVPGAPPTLPVVLWHVIPELKNPAAASQ